MASQKFHMQKEKNPPKTKRLSKKRKKKTFTTYGNFSIIHQRPIPNLHDIFIIRHDGEIRPSSTMVLVLVLVMVLVRGGQSERQTLVGGFDAGDGFEFPFEMGDGP